MTASVIAYIILYCCLILIATVFATLVDRESGWMIHLFTCIIATPYYVLLLTLAKLLRIKFFVSILEVLQTLLCFIFFIANIMMCLSFGDVLADAYNNRMHKLNYTEADGTKIVTYIANDDEYNKDYLSEELQANSAKEVGYVLEVTMSSKDKLYKNLSTYMDEKVTVQTLRLKLIDCDTNQTIASTFIDPEFPGSTTKSYIPVPESTVMEWVVSAYPG